MEEHKYINCFPGYEKVIEWNAEGKKIVHNMYRGTDLGLGGYVYFEEGIYINVALVDVSNMHGGSIIALNKFGDKTKNFADVREANLAIKHKEFDKLKTLMGGKLAKYIDDPNTDWKAMRTALKLVSNSTFGVSAATFDNPLRDSRDDNDIIALRGALFMRTLQDEVVNRGYKVAHIKTDSIKIPNATPEIVKFCMEFAKVYDYEFEFEAVYDKLCLVNGSTYVARYMSTEDCQRLYNYIPAENKEHEESGNMWTATAAQFQQPYVFKTLFSHEPIEFKDMCEVKSVKSALYLDFNEDLSDVSGLEDAVSKWNKSLKKLNVLENELQNSKNGFGRKVEEVQKDLDKEDRAIWRQQLYLQNALGTDYIGSSLMDLALSEIDKGHKYQFIGGVGLFCPMVDGAGGGLLVRTDNNGGYAAVTGTKGYRWMESEAVELTEKKDLVNHDYYRVLVDEAVKDITSWCEETNKKTGSTYTFEWFVSDDPVVKSEPVPDFMNVPIDSDEEVPFEE